MGNQYFQKLNGYTVNDPRALHMGLSGMIVKEANQAPHKMYDIIKTYMDNMGKLYYDTPGFVGYDYDEATGKFTPQSIHGKYDADGNPCFPIVCSSLVWLALLGVGYENCRVNTGEIVSTEVDGETVPMLVGGENIPYSGCKMVDLTEKEILDYWGNSGHGTVYSANIAKLFHDAGMLHKIKTKDFSEILPGDLLFYDNYVEGTQSTTPFLNINHVEMFVGWQGDAMVGITTENDDSGDPVIKHSAYKKNSSFAKYLKYYVRIPSAAGEPVRYSSTSGSMQFTETTTGGIDIPLNTPATFAMKPATAYPVVIEIDPGAVGTGKYINIYLVRNGTMQTDQNFPVYIDANKAQCIAPNKYYTTIVTPAEIPGNITGLRIYGKGSGSYSYTVKSAKVYEKLIQVG